MTNKKPIFWITNGVNNWDDYRVVVSTDKLIDCSHCYNTKQGFQGIGMRYAICKNCLYRPSQELRIKNFITVSKKKDSAEWDKFLDRCENKEDYLKLVAEVTI